MTTITVPRAVLEQALEALEPMQNNRDDTAIQRAITALRASLAKQEQEQEQEQEPVAWMVEFTSKNGGGQHLRFCEPRACDRPLYKTITPLHTTPPRREWQSLTEDEIDDLSRTMVKGNKSVNWLTLAILAALKEKNNG